MKNKKLILKLIVISAIVIAFASMFVPATSFNLSDAYEAEGYEKPEMYWERGHSILISYLIEYDNRNPEEPAEYHSYRFLHVFQMGEYKGLFSTASVFEEDPFSLRNPTSQMTLIAGVVLFFIFFTYFCYKGIKDCNRIKTKYFLYAGIIFSACFVFNLVHTYYGFGLLNTTKLTYTNHINFLYGFYLMLIAIVLFFTAHFMQHYFLELPEKEIKKERS